MNVQLPQLLNMLTTSTRDKIASQLCTQIIIRANIGQNQGNTSDILSINENFDFFDAFLENKY